MKKYFIIDSCVSKAGVEWNEMLPTNSKDDAISIAKSEWLSISAHDRKKRDSFYLAEGIESEENPGNPDYDTLDVIWEAF